jgi:hypothetical protein
VNLVDKSSPGKILSKPTFFAVATAAAALEFKKSSTTFPAEPWTQQACLPIFSQLSTSQPQK